MALATLDILERIASTARRLETADSKSEPLRWQFAEQVAAAADSGVSYREIALRSGFSNRLIYSYAAAWRKFGTVKARPQMAEALIEAMTDPETYSAMVAIADARGVKVTTTAKSRADRAMVEDLKERLKVPEIAQAVLADPEVVKQVARTVVEDTAADAAFSIARGQRDTRAAKSKAAVRSAAGNHGGDRRAQEEASNWLLTLSRLGAARRAIRHAFDVVEPSTLDEDSRADLLRWADDIIASAKNFKTYVANGDEEAFDKALAAILGE